MDYIRFRIEFTMSSSGSRYRDIPYPKKFEMHKVPNIVNELHTMSGNVLYDVNGWKWADTTLEWGALYPETLEDLLEITEVAKLNELYMQFLDTDGETKEVRAVIKEFKKAKTLVKYGNRYVWDGLSLTLSFPECHPYASNTSPDA